MIRKLALSFSLTLLVTSVPVMAWETEQYTLPTEELYDIGPKISEHIYNSIDKAVTVANTKMDELEKKISEKKSMGKKAKDEIEKLKKIKSRKGMAKIVFTELAPPIAHQEHLDAIWRQHIDLFPHDDGRVDGKPIAFDPPITKTVYAYAGFHRVVSASYFIHSATIKAYGVEYGMDKLGHAFAQGYTYYNKFLNQLAKGKTPAKALAKAVKWGVNSERTYYGKWVDGVYANGDLAANMAGFHLYKNLFETTNFFGKDYPAILVQDKDGRYSMSREEINTHDLYKRMVSRHFNEAFNPSQYELLQRPIIRRAVKNRCAAWLKRYPNYKKADYDKILKDLSLWNGIDYGHRHNRLISIGKSCFKK